MGWRYWREIGLEIPCKSTLLCAFRCLCLGTLTVRVADAHVPLKKKAVTMSIGLGIFLFVVGAILVWALNIQVDWVDLDLVGYILMGAGALIFVLGLVLLTRRRSSISTTRSAVDPVNGERVVQQERSIDEV